MLRLKNCLLWMSGNSRKGGGLEVVIGIFRPCVGDFCAAYPLPGLSTVAEMASLAAFSTKMMLLTTCRMLNAVACSRERQCRGNMPS